MRSKTNILGYCRDMNHWLQSGAEKKGVHYNEIIPAQINNLSVPPKVVDFQKHPKFGMHQKYISSPGFVLTLDDAVVYPKEKFIRTAGGYVIADLIDSPDKPETRAGWRPNIISASKDTLRVSKTVAVFLMSPRSYYDWMTKMASKVHLLVKGGYWKKIDYFLVVDCLYDYQRALFRKLGIEKKLLTQAMLSDSEIKRLIVTPSCLEMPKWTCRALRRLLLSFNHSNKTSRFDRIYISRRDAKVRKITNEKELIAFLNKFGFVEVVLAEFDIASQVSLFKNANIIIGGHGSGFTNIACCQKGTKVIELLSPDYVHSMFWEMSNYLSLNYGYVICEENSQGRLSPKPLWEQDVSVNIGRLEKMLRMMDIELKGAHFA